MVEEFAMVGSDTRDAVAEDFVEDCVGDADVWLVGILIGLIGNHERNRNGRLERTYRMIGGPCKENRPRNR